MLVYVLPISGGSFPTQIEIVAELGEYGIRPDICFSCSGGNIAAYVGSAGSWKRENIEEVVKNINSCMMLEKWAPGPLMYLYAYFTGSLYRAGSGVYKFFNHYFTRQTIQVDEIWTSTYDRKAQMACYFCNLSGPRHICPSIDTSLLQCHPVRYLAGDVHQISVVSQASASIPTYVESQIIANGEHCDGGVSTASPFGVLKSSIPKKDLHVIYINGMDVEKHDGDCSYRNIFGNGILAMSEVTRNKILHDRTHAVENICCEQHAPHRKSFAIEHLPEVLKLQKELRSSVIEIYPEEYQELDITNFDGNDILLMMSKVQLKFRIWWEGPYDIFNHILPRSF